MCTTMSGLIEMESYEFFTRMAWNWDPSNLCEPPCLALLYLKSSVYTKACTKVLLRVIFINANTWKQWCYPSVGQWTMKHFPSVKWNELSSCEKTWKKLKCILLSERGHSEKAAYCIISTMWHARKAKIMETVKVS
jgi:hypothetical protein